MDIYLVDRFASLRCGGNFLANSCTDGSVWKSQVSKRIAPSDNSLEVGHAVLAIPLLMMRGVRALDLVPRGAEFLDARCLEWRAVFAHRVREIYLHAAGLFSSQNNPHSGILRDANGRPFAFGSSSSR